MKSIIANVAGGAALALVLTQPAFAERGQGSYYAPPSFGSLDEDRNGALDRGEVEGRTPLYGQWQRYDANGDGFIEPSEFAAFEVREGAMDLAPPKAPLETAPTRPGAAESVK